MCGSLIRSLAELFSHNFLSCLLRLTACASDCQRPPTRGTTFPFSRQQAAFLISCPPPHLPRICWGHLLQRRRPTITRRRLKQKTLLCHILDCARAIANQNYSFVSLISKNKVTEGIRVDHSSTIWAHSPRRWHLPGLCKTRLVLIGKVFYNGRNSLISVVH